MWTKLLEKLTIVYSAPKHPALLALVQAYAVLLIALVSQSYLASSHAAKVVEARDQVSEYQKNRLSSLSIKVRYL